jgi:hypothetical protein
MAIEGRMLDTKELVDSYNARGTSKINIMIFDYEEGAQKRYTIKAINKSKENHKVVFDPKRILKVGQYVGCYYCNKSQDLKVILDYLYSEALMENKKESEDVLDLDTTQRYSFLD